MKSGFLTGAPRALYRGRKKAVRKFTGRQGILVLATCGLVMIFLMLFLLNIVRVE